MFNFTAMVRDLESNINIFEQLVVGLKHSVPTFTKLLEIIHSLPEGSVFMVGGAVRDAFLRPGLAPKDLDIFLSAGAFEVLRPYLLKEGSLQRNPFGTYRWFGQGDGSVYYDIIVIEQFYNGLWNCRDIVDALNQFDMTANAIAFDLDNGACYNPQNGILDIEHKVLRAVRFDFPELDLPGNIPLSRNTVLWFRFQHYAQTLGLQIEPLTKQWIFENQYRAAASALFAAHFFQPHLAHV